MSDEGSIWGKIGGIAAAVILVGMIVLIVLGNRAGCSRAAKTFESHMNNGLERTFTVYDYNGNKVFEDSGKLDYAYTDGKWYYDKDGKRTSTSGGIVIVQEQ